MTVMEKVNVDLLGPLLIVFVLLRLKKHYCIPLKFLSGIRFFVSNSTLSQKHLRIPATASSLKNQSIIDKKLQDFNLSMIELDGSTRKGSIFQGILFYNVYENLVYLSISSVAVHFFSTLFHCYSPHSAHSIWGTIFISLSVALPFRNLLRMLFTGGMGVFERRVTLLVALTAFLVSVMMLLSPVELLGLSLDDVLLSTAKHSTALLLHLSSTAWQPSIGAMVFILKVSLSLLSSLAALGMVMPAMHFSQSFSIILFGEHYERGSAFVRSLLVLDHFLPLFVATIMIPNGLGLGVLSQSADGYWLAAQLAATFLMVAIRLICMRKLLQSYLDTVVKSISLHIARSDSTKAVCAEIQEIVAARHNFLPCAAAQYVSVPLTVLGLVLLVHKAAPQGTGMCVDFRNALGLDTSTMISISQVALSYDATSAALEMSSKGEPTLMNGVYLFLMSAGEGGVSPSRDLRLFITRLATSLHLLPVGAFVALGRAAIAVHCILWFTITSLCILYWFWSPQSLKKATGGDLVLKKNL